MLSTGAWAETLQEKIDAAEAGAIITLTEDVTISQTVLINKNITIDGGNHTIISNVNNKLGTFYINTGTCNFTIQNATIDGGNTASMAVVAYRGTANSGLTTVDSANRDNNNSGNVINMTNCTVKNFTGFPDSYAGAVYVFGQSSANLTNCTFSGNTTSLQSTDGASGADVWAGAAAKVKINGGSYQEVFVNSNKTNDASITISNGAKVEELSVCVTENGGSTNQPSITVDNASVINITTETGNTIPSSAVTIKNDGRVTNIPTEYVAQIGDKKYSSLISAINVATSGQTITLLTDVTISTVDELTIDKALTLDLANHTITSTVKEPIIVKNGGDLTITGNGTITGPTGEAGKALDGHAIITVEGGKLKYLNGTLTCGGVGSDGMYGVYVLGNGTAVFGNESDKTGPTITSWFAAIGENNTTAPANITVYGGSYTAQASPSESDWWSYFCAPIYAAGSGEINISGGEFNGYYGLSSRYSNIDQDLNITGGTFTGTKSALFFDNKTGVASSESREVAVSGGTFSSAVPEEYCADGFIPTKNNDGTYGVKEGSYVAQIGSTKYATLAEAVAAVQNSETVTLISDINESVENTNANNFTVDLNGKTWTSDQTSTFKNNGGTVTITDESGNGTIKNTANAKDMGIAVWARTGSVVIENGTFINQSNYEATLYVGTTAANLGSKQPTMTVKGGTFKNEATGKYAHKDSLLPLTLNVINNITSYQAISISGGTFYGNDPALGDDNLGTGVAGGNFLADGYVAEKKADGTYGVREGVFVAKIGDKKYESLADAVAAATDGQTITLLADVTVNKTILIEKNITIDGDGHTISSTVTSILGTFYVNVPTCTFAIENATIDGQNTASMAVCVYRGKANNTLDATPTVDTNNSGNNVTLTDCTVKNFTGWPGSYVGAVYAYSKSHLTLNNCTFTGNTTTLSTNGASGADVWTGAATTVVINGGTYNEVFVNTNSTNVETVTINGGAKIEELAICVSYKNDGSTNIPVLTIDNATVTYLTTEEGNPIPETGITIQNEGSITNKPAFEAAKILNGTKTNAFASLDEAIDAAKAEQTITLLKDATATKELPTNVTIDAASHVLTLPTFTVSDGSALTYAKVINATEDTYKVTTATYNRTGATGTQWGTVCLPFSFESAPDGYTLYTPTAVNATTLTVTEVSYPVAAGTPVIFYKNTTDEAVITSANASVKINAAPVAQSGDIHLVGTFSNQKIESNLSSIYFINGDKFHQAQVSLTVPAYRAYINYTGTAAGAKPSILSILVGGETTGVEKVSMENESVEGIYDVNGMKLSAPKKGMNIMKLANGKTVKLIVK